MNNNHRCFTRPPRNKPQPGRVSAISDARSFDAAFCLVDDCDEAHLPPCDGERAPPLPIDSFATTTPLRRRSKKKELDADFLKIACPAFVQFAAEPLARLIDTAYLGRLGANALGGAGAAIAAQYSVSKLYNDPLLRTTISIVAAQEGAEPEERANAVSTALLLALVVGVIQGTAFFLLAGPVLRAMSVGPMSPMRSSALGYLRVCSLGAPSVTLWLAANGVFRGLGDTATPLLWALAFTCMNALLDPLFIFRFHMGAAGAAAAPPSRRPLLSSHCYWPCSETACRVARGWFYWAAFDPSCWSICSYGRHQGAHVVRAWLRTGRKLRLASIDGENIRVLGVCTRGGTSWCRGLRRPQSMLSARCRDDTAL